MSSSRTRPSDVTSPYQVLPIKVPPLPDGAWGWLGMRPSACGHREHSECPNVELLNEKCVVVGPSVLYPRFAKPQLETHFSREHQRACANVRSLHLISE